MTNVILTCAGRLPPAQHYPDTSVLVYAHRDRNTYFSSPQRPLGRLSGASVDVCSLECSPGEVFACACVQGKRPLGTALEGSQTSMFRFGADAAKITKMAISRHHALRLTSGFCNMPVFIWSTRPKTNAVKFVDRTRLSPYFTVNHTHSKIMGLYRFSLQDLLLSRNPRPRWH